MAKNEFTCDCNIIHKEVVDFVLIDFPDIEKFNKVSEFFKILGDSTRSKIIWSLSKSEMCVCDIANVLGMSKSSVSHQLRTLRRSDFVKCRKVGKTVYYSLSDDHVKNLFKLGFEHINHN